eukprot:GHVR01134282.1.p1 GENE.GHVR01134282.1~~GHVR01134282.1.p1  ORF type:complete len:299 (-),score=71.97 GHVR01134282.1:10-906(-)
MKVLGTDIHNTQLNVHRSLVQENLRLNPVQIVPSCVVYVRGVAPTVTDSHLRAACTSFGPVVDVLILSEKANGFVEFESIEAAQTCHRFSGMVYLHGRTLEFSWSGRDKIERKLDMDRNLPSRVLLVTVSDVKYRVDVAVMRQIFQPYNLQKVVIFQRPSSFSQYALVEVADLPSALCARDGLDKCNIYAGCNYIRIQFSGTRQTLEVKKNSNKAWDINLESNENDGSLGNYTHTHLHTHTHSQASNAEAQNGSLGENYSDPYSGTHTHTQRAIRSNAHIETHTHTNRNTLTHEHTHT